MILIIIEYSGITELLLNPIQTRLEQIQAFLIRYIDPQNDIFVGHSLENDFHALRLLPTTKIIDTSVLFRQHNNNGGGGRKYGTCVLLF